MLFVLSPAKRLDIDFNSKIEKYSRPDLIRHTAELIKLLKLYSPAQLGSLLRISDHLAALNAGRYATWSPQADLKNAKQAIFTYDGDVYRGLDAASLNDFQVDYAQTHIRILSGLYGILSPLDLIQPYRLEMGTKLPNSNGKDLYAFWDSAVTDAINRDLERNNANVLINLASDEYYRVINTKRLHARVIAPVFQEMKNGKWKIIPVHAKRARGLMARYASVNGVTDAEQLKAFDTEDYAFEPAASGDNLWVFRR
jgi:hypothetical protein